MCLEKQSTICALLKRAPWRVALASGDYQKPGELGCRSASKTEQMVAKIGPAALFQRRGSFERIEAISFQSLRILRLVSESDPRHIVIHSLICSTRVATCGARFVPKNQATVEITHARVLPIFKLLHIVLCRVTMNLKRMDARHREILRDRVHPAKNDRLSQLFAFLSRCVSIDWMRIFFSRLRFRSRDLWQLSHGTWALHLPQGDQRSTSSAICHLPGEWICKTGSGPTWLCRLSPCQFGLHRAAVDCDSSASQIVTDRHCAPRRPIQGSRTPEI